MLVVKFGQTEDTGSLLSRGLAKRASKCVVNIFILCTTSHSLHIVFHIFHSQESHLIYRFLDLAFIGCV